MSGFILPTLISIPYFHLLEFVHKDKRAFFGILVVGLHSCSYLIIAMLFKYLQNWKIFYTILTIESGLGLICYTFCIPESARYYIVQRDFFSARRTLFFISQINQRSHFKGNFIEEAQPQNDLPIVVHSRTSLKRKLTTLCQNAANRMLILSLCVPLIVCIFQNSAIFIIIEDEEDQPYINYIVVAFGDILACICFAFLANKIGRKKTILFGLGIASLTCFIYSFLKKNETSTYATMLCSRFANIGAFATLSLFSVEVLLTEVRGSILGFILSLSYLCVMLVPSFSAFKENLVATLAILELMGFFVCFALPETIGRDMENTVIN